MHQESTIYTSQPYVEASATVLEIWKLLILLLETSNQAAITNELLKPENKSLLEELVEKHGKEGWEVVYDMAVRLYQDSWRLSTSDNISVLQAVRFCSRNIPYLSGRVLVQTSLRYLNDKDAIMKQCHFYASRFEEAGVSRDRFAIKLPFSGAAATAAYELNAEGIRTLATAVFSLEQAIAASQSNCLFISPYYNGKWSGDCRPPAIVCI